MNAKAPQSPPADLGPPANPPPLPPKYSLAMRREGWITEAEAEMLYEMAKSGRAVVIRRTTVVKRSESPE